MTTYDLLIIGGGINGAGIARDAAGRGLSVLLCEQGDLAGATSSASSKLIHGGLRYLEQYEFGLVRKALKEREVLLRAAPHIVRPLNFVLPHDGDLRPAWLIRIGLLLYDHLGARELLPGSSAIKLAAHPAGAALHDRYAKGFVYSDCFVQDGRLTVLACQGAAEQGAEILTRTQCVQASREGKNWRAKLRRADGGVQEVSARSLVNAAGPWAGSILGSTIETRTEAPIRLVKGSHIITRKLFDHDFAYILQGADGRVVFAIPFEDEFTLIGTTDEAYEGDPANCEITSDEIDYLCAVTKKYFRHPALAEDVVKTFSGVRPLYDDGAKSASAVTRDYVFDLEHDGEGAPLLSIFGGKITTFRVMAEAAVSKLAPILGNEASAWTAGAQLPGGDIPGADMDRFLADFRTKNSWLPDALSARLAANYGSRADAVLDGARSLDDLGEYFGDNLYAGEILYLMENEWAQTAEDILWRRSKLLLHISSKTREKLDVWLSEHEHSRQSTSGKIYGVTN